MQDFFISHSSKDDTWANTIVQILEEAGYTTIVDHRDFRIGTSFIRQMNSALERTRYTIAVYSKNYFEATYTSPEWEAVFNKDPNGEKGLLIPVLIQECELPPLLATRIYSNLINKDETECRSTLLSGLQHIARTSPSPSTDAVIFPTETASALIAEFPHVRPSIIAFQKALERRENFILIKGAGEIGQAALVNYGIQYARNTGAKILRTDFSEFSDADFHSRETLFQAIAVSMAEQRNKDINLNSIWNPNFDANKNFGRFLQRRILNGRTDWVAWALCDADRLFSFEVEDPKRGAKYHLGTEVFNLFKAWRHSAASDTNSVWKRLTLLVSCMNGGYHPPFSPNLTAVLEDLERDHIALWNKRVGSPLRDSEEIARFMNLVGGHPALVWEGLQFLAKQYYDLASLESQAISITGPFADHLRRLWNRLALDNELKAVVNTMIEGKPPSVAWFFRLCDEGILIGKDANHARFRCPLYKTFLQSYPL